MSSDLTNIIVSGCYFVASLLFLFGLKMMSSPKTATRGIHLAGIGMLIAVFATFLIAPHNTLLMTTALTLSSLLCWYTGKTVAMTNMPQMVALYNGMGGGAAAAIALVELIKPGTHSYTLIMVALAGALIGAVAFSGSIIAYAKLQGILKKSIRITGIQLINALIALGIVVAVAYYFLQPQLSLLLIIIGLAILLGITVTIPIGGADMPVIISLYNGFTGLAVGLEGFVLNNPAMIIAGTVVGASGMLLTRLMAKAMNRPILTILFSSFGASASATTTTAQPRATTADDVAMQIAYATRVIIVPGYGLAVAQAQQKVAELAAKLEAREVEVLFAIHPVAGRMPGHMNVLLAEAGIDYDRIKDLDEINPDFPHCDVAIVIGANDVTNPSARNDKTSPLYGMPILDADRAKQVVVIKRGSGTGFSGAPNPLFTLDHTTLLYGDGQAALGQILTALKQVD